MPPGPPDPSGEDERAGRWWWRPTPTASAACTLRLAGGATAAAPGDRFDAALGRLRADVNARTWETTNGC